MLLLPAHLLKMVPDLDDAKAGVFSGVINQAAQRFGIDTPKRLAMFMGQVLVESGDLKSTREKMSYSAARLMAVWPSRFPTLAIASQYENQPQKLANFVYANRMGNGGPETNDGWNHRGAGWLQLTGKTNQEACGTVLGVSLEGIGDWLATTLGAAQSSAWFWDKNSVNRLADFGNIDSVSDAVNIGHLTTKIGDAEGYAKRVVKTQLCLNVLGVS